MAAFPISPRTLRAIRQRISDMGDMDIPMAPATLYALVAAAEGVGVQPREFSDHTTQRRVDAVALEALVNVAARNFGEFYTDVRNYAAQRAGSGPGWNDRYRETLARAGLAIRVLGPTTTSYPYPGGPVCAPEPLPGDARGWPAGAVIVSAKGA